MHVVIIGFSHGGSGSRRILFEHTGQAEDDVVELTVPNINPYLVNAATVIASRRRTPMTAEISVCRFGSMPNDDQKLIVDADERDRILETDPIAAAYLRELIGADEMLNGVHRYCLWLVHANPADIRSSPTLREKVAAVRAYRLSSSRAATRALAATPGLFGEIRQPQSGYLCLPRHTSLRRDYIPMAYFTADDIAHDSTLTIQAAPLFLFGVLNSEMFMTWVRTVAGRLKSDFRLSTELVYNTFPWPAVTAAKTREVEDLAQAVLDSRASHSRATLADLYDPASMPPDLAHAHIALNRTVGRLYGRRRTTTELERQAILFDRYTDLWLWGFPPTPLVGEF